VSVAREETGVADAWQGAVQETTETSSEAELVSKAAAALVEGTGIDEWRNAGMDYEVRGAKTEAALLGDTRARV